MNNKIETVETNSGNNSLVDYIFRNSPQKPYSINIELGEESFDGITGSKAQNELLNEFLTDILYSGIKILYGENVSMQETLMDLNKLTLLRKYMASIGMYINVNYKMHMQTGKVVEQQISFTPFIQN